jgi:hypothetical protein
VSCFAILRELSSFARTNIAFNQAVSRKDAKAQKIAKKKSTINVAQIPRQAGRNRYNGARSESNSPVAVRKSQDLAVQFPAGGSAWPVLAQ